MEIDLGKISTQAVYDVSQLPLGGMMETNAGKRIAKASLDLPKCSH